MAEFSEVVKQFKRMCKSISAAKCIGGECPMGCEFGCKNIGQCRRIVIEEYDKFEKLVMAWAVKNPEPVYMTWSEWFESLSLGIEIINADKEILAEIAEKLGIEPKEDA